METIEVDADSDALSPGTSLPQFLKPVQLTQCSATQVSVPVHAVYTHSRPFGDAHVLWWPPQTRRRVCDSSSSSSNKTVPTRRTILLFIPGNPGLLEFYVPFLNAIYRSVNSDASSSSSSSSSSSPSSTNNTTSVTIFAHSHLGLSSYIRLGSSDKSYFSWPEKSSVALRAQIQAHLEFLDELLATYDDDPTTRVLLVGHSIGCWLIQEMLKARATGALRPRVGAYFLFPTISHIARSPNGRKLSLFFRPPWPRTLAYLALLFRHIIPLLFILRLLRSSWPTSQLRVVHNLLRAPAVIYASLTMANDEMETVRELDTEFLRDFAQNSWFYYAEEDNWVGEQFAVVLRVLRGTGTPMESHMVIGRSGIPHAFCINHSAEVASQCVEWMRAGGFLSW